MCATTFRDHAAPDRLGCLAVSGVPTPDSIVLSTTTRLMTQPCLELCILHCPCTSDIDISRQQGSYVGIHSTGFRDFLLKPELLRAISDLGFEHPSEVQQECIPQSILGMDVVCQAKSGMGKTAVFVLATLQQIEPVDGEVSVLVLCHTRELAYQIRNEYARFTKYMPDVRTGVIYGGTPVAENQAMLKDKTKCPHILVGTPGRMNALVRDKSLKVSGVKHFVIDECDKILEQVDMRRDVQDIFRATPHHKQVMMFSATLAKEVRPTCKKFMQNVSAR
ncbi:hypothetical protein PANT_3d00031 [Moesziomyces antarcticus T-34]|uniref:RNA helicase n=1 Tax=Pseudozyma antarctica (strain T-34) TaxID=1151754 RepID=M9MC52_PSEA3|nr:hypothetical protein PANT_3d00031 [Moesziomyces antarcticus T-34]